MTIGTMMMTTARVTAKAIRRKRSKYAHGRYISYAQARRAALSRISGRVKDIDFDRDDGYPHYDVEIIKRGREYNVKVDARTGRVVSVRRDAKPDGNKVL